MRSKRSPMKVNVSIDAMRYTMWNRSCRFSAGGEQLGEGLGPKLQEEHAYDNCDCPDYLHGFHPLSEDHICQDFRGSRLSHIHNAGMAGFDVTESRNVGRICSKG